MSLVNGFVIGCLDSELSIECGVGVWRAAGAWTVGSRRAATFGSDGEQQRSLVHQDFASSDVTRREDAEATARRLHSARRAENNVRHRAQSGIWHAEC